MGPTRIDGPGTAVRCVVAMLAAFAIATHLALSLTGRIEAWLLPAAMMAGSSVAIFWPVRFANSGDSLRVVPKWVPIVAVLAMVAAFVAVTWGALATPPREWDGIVSWAQRARLMTPPWSVTRPELADPAVYLHARNYPTLQPMLLGSLRALFGARFARLLFPLLWLLFGTTLLAGLRRVGLPRSIAWTTVACAVLTPMWLNVGAGSVDSGYADLFLSAALMVAAVGVATRSWIEVALGVFLLPLIKPEGVPYAVLVWLVVLVANRRGASIASLTALGVALVLRLDPMGSPDLLLALAIPVALSLLGWWLATVRRSFGVLVCGAILASFIAGAVAFGLRATEGPLVAYWTASLGWTHLDWHVLGGIVRGLFWARKLGLVFVILALLAVSPRRVAGRCPSRPLAMLTALHVLVAIAALLLSPETNLEHELRSRFDRLLLHGVGVHWLLIGWWVGGDLVRRARSENFCNVGT